MPNQRNIRDLFMMTKIKMAGFLKSGTKIYQNSSLRSQLQTSKEFFNEERYTKAKEGLKILINDYFWNTNTVDPKNKAILITGCDHGFGHSLAKKLESRGFHVFASCLNPADAGATELKKECSKSLRILPLDVRKEESVQDAVKYLKNKLGTSKLFAIVNNAGIRKGCSLEFSKVEDYKECLDVNTIGPIRVTKAFLPMLKESRGRVINVNCILGRVGVPHCSTYVMSQFGRSAFNDCIRQELNAWGIRVISVEPELFKTQLTDKDAVLKTIEDAISSTDERTLSLYGTDYLRNFKKYAIFCSSLASDKTSAVLKDLQSAITMENPWPSYRPARNFFTKFLIWDYEYKTHFNRDAIYKLVLKATSFPKPKIIEEAEQLKFEEDVTSQYEKKPEKLSSSKVKKAS